MRTFKGQKGLSLIEVTIMLLVLMLLTGVLAPSIYDFVNDAKWVKVKEDCEAIALTVARLQRDVGCIRFAQASPCTKANKVEFLFSDGIKPNMSTNVLPATDTLTAGVSVAQNPTYNWSDAMNPLFGDAMSDQFVTNAPTYVVAGNGPASPWGPNFNIGWRGAYLSAPIGPDPFGQAYLVNTIFLNVASDATGSGEGSTTAGGWHHDTFCLSAGPNNVYETPIASAGTPPNGAVASGDDFITIIAGGSR